MVMQVSTTQAAKAFAALRASRHRAASRRRRRPRPTGWAGPRAIDEALAHIDELPRIRADHVARAKHRLAAGDEPTSLEVADAIVRRATCDALR
jgi:hypothetical protein